MMMMVIAIMIRGLNASLHFWIFEFMLVSAYATGRNKIDMIFITVTTIITITIIITERDYLIYICGLVD